MESWLDQLGETRSVGCLIEKNGVTELMDKPLELISVTKRFGDFTAVKDVSMHLKKGEIVGFLGPNGAGKSTSLRLALGIMSPDEGRAELFGALLLMSSLRG